MGMKKGLQRFIEAQENDYQLAFAEIKRGRKQSHWMWYIFPQLQGLGFSETSKYYGIRSLDEAKAYLEHPVLGGRLVRICKKLLELDVNDARQIFGSPDDMKLRSSMTLFATVPGCEQVFDKVLKKFFQGEPDLQTMTLLN
jgi:uncharacterized protein (DUF1810 family)